MPRPISPELIVRGRCADPTWRQRVEAYVLENNADGTPREHVRSTKAHWAEADGGAAGVDADFIRKENGDLTLKGTLRTLVTYSPGAVTYFTDLDALTPWDVPMVEFPDAEPPELEIDRIKLYLNPLRVPTQKREVHRWRLELMRPVALFGGGVGTIVTMLPIADPIDMPITSDAAGFVTFDYAAQGLTRPRPLWPPPETIVVTAGDVALILSDFRRRHIYLFLRALKEDGTPGAGNVGLGYDAGTAEFAAAGYKLRSRRFTKDDSLTTRVLLGSWGYKDGGSAGGAPYCTIEAGSYATPETITFSTNPFDAGGTPDGDLELIGQIQTPEGTSVTLEVRNDADAAYVPFTDGQVHSDVGIGKTQPRKMQATLTPNAAGTLAPTLKRLGLRGVTRLDGSRVCEVRSFEEAFEPEDLHTEIANARLVGIKDGEQDFQSWIENLLAEHYPKNILLRCWIMDSALPRHQWLHKTDVLIGNWIGKGSEIELQGITPLVKLKDMVPPYSPGTNYAPDGTTDVGGWTDLAGGAANLHLNVDEALADNSDAVRSPTSPAGAEIRFSLPTPTDLAGRRLFVDIDYFKDASGGDEQIDIEIRLYNNTTLVASLLKADIGLNRTQTTMELTDPQIALLNDLPNLRIGVWANNPAGAGASRAVVTWYRFRSGGRREAVTYVGQTLKAVSDDLVDNRLALEKRYRGPLIESTAFTVSKQLTGVRKRNPNGKEIVGKNELEAIAFLAGGIVHEVQGRIVFTSVFGSKPIVAVFPSSRIRLPEAGPGLDRRRPEYFIGYRWDPAKEEFRDEGHYFHQPSLDAYGRDTLGPPKWLDEEIAKYIDTDVLVDHIGLRMVNTFACGEMLWPFYSIDAWPEIHIGDLVAVQTDKFCGRDPNIARELRGKQWVVGIIQRADFWGRNFTIWVRSPADILSSAQAASRIGFSVPDLYEATPNVNQKGEATLNFKARAAQSLRYAFNTGTAPAEPSAATIRAAAVAALDADGVLRTGILATLPAGQKIKGAAFAYERGDGTGAESKLLPFEITHYDGQTGCSIVEKSSTDYTVTFRLQGTDADGENVKIHYRSVLVSAPLDDYTSGTIVSDAAFAAQPRGKEVTVDRGLTNRYIEAWAEDVNGNKSAIVRAPIPAMTSAAQEAGIATYSLTNNWVGSCVGADSEWRITHTWTKHANVPTTWTVDLIYCDSLGTGCSPASLLGNFAVTASPQDHDRLPGEEEDIVTGTQHFYNGRIVLKNSYGESVDTDNASEQNTFSSPC